MVWTFADEVSYDELNHFIKTGELGDAQEAVMPYNPAIMQAIANQKWSM